MSPEDRNRLRHMIDAARTAQRFLLGRQRSDLDTDDMLRFAVVRAIEIIGEASKKLPEDVKSKQPDIEWRKVTGMRDRLIHDYFGVDYTIVWDVATTKLPDLRKRLQSLLETIVKRQQASAPDAKSRGPK